MSEPDPFSHVERLKKGDEIWVVIDDENWLKRVVRIDRNDDGSISLSLEDGIDALDK